MYGYVWLCRAVYGSVGLCRAMYGYVGLCRAMGGEGEGKGREWKGREGRKGEGLACEQALLLPGLGGGMGGVGQ